MSHYKSLAALIAAATLAACGGDQSLDPSDNEFGFEVPGASPVPTMAPPTLPPMVTPTPTMVPSTVPSAVPSVTPTPTVTPTTSVEPTPFVSARADATGDFFEAILFSDADETAEFTPDSGDDSTSDGFGVEIAYEMDLDAAALTPNFRIRENTDANPTASEGEENIQATISFDPAIDTVVGRTFSVDVAIPDDYEVRDDQGNITLPIKVGFYTFDSSGSDCSFSEAEIVETFNEWVTYTFTYTDTSTGIGYGAGTVQFAENCGVQFTGTNIARAGFLIRTGAENKDLTETIYVDNFTISNISTTTNPDPVASIAATGSFTETDADTDVNVAVTLDSAAAEEVVIPFTLGGTATLDTDYSSAANSVTIPAGSTTANIVLNIKGDTLSEEAETIIITLGEPTSGTADLGNASQTLTITDNDAQPSVTVSALAQTVTENSGEVTVELSLSNASASEITVDYGVTGTATEADSDLMEGTVTFTAGETTQNISFDLTDDTDLDDGETIIITLRDPNGATLGTEIEQTITITDDDSNSFVGVRFVPTSLPEDAANNLTQIVFSTDQAAVSDITVNYTISGTSDTDDSNATFGAGSIVISMGTSSNFIEINKTDDNLVEPDETIVVTLDSVTGTNVAVGDDSDAIFTITNDDTTEIQFGADPAAVVEGGAIEATVSLSNPSSQAVTATVTVTDVETTSDDYTAPDTTVTIPANATSATFTVQTTDDSLDEVDDETLTLTLSAPNGATLGANTSSTLTISDNDDAPTVSWTTASQSVTEGATGVTATLQLSAASGREVQVPYTVGGTAQAADYSSLAGATATFAAGDTDEVITFDIVDDPDTESDETIVLDITDTSLTNVTLGANDTHTVTIAASDALVNSVPNGDVETGQVSPWIVSFGNTTPTLTVVTSNGAPDSLVFEGDDALQITGRDANFQGIAYELKDTLQPNRQYDLSMQVRLVQGQPSSNITASIYRNGPGGATFPQFASQTIDDTAWVQLSGRIETPSDIASFTNFQMYTQEPSGNNASFILDDFQVTDAGPAPDRSFPLTFDNPIDASAWEINFPGNSGSNGTSALDYNASANALDIIADWATVNESLAVRIGSLEEGSIDLSGATVTVDVELPQEYLDSTTSNAQIGIYFFANGGVIGFAGDQDITSNSFTYSKTLSTTCADSANGGNYSFLGGGFDCTNVVQIGVQIKNSDNTLTAPFTIDNVTFTPAP